MRVGQNRQDGSGSHAKRFPRAARIHNVLAGFFETALPAYAIVSAIVICARLVLRRMRGSSPHIRRDLSS
jgi:hypothetical protein